MNGKRGSCIVQGSREKVRTLVVGFGDGGNVFVRGIQKNPSEIDIVGIVDADPNKQHSLLYNIPVLGAEDDIPRIEDVLTIKLDRTKISAELAGKVVLVSGTGGSIGSEICRQVSKFEPKTLLLLGHGENSIYLVDKELKNMYGRSIEIIPVIADVQDPDRIFKVMERYRPDYVFHAASHKHVPFMEDNPTEAIKNNVFGSKNMAEVAKAAGVKNFVMVSTDKAVRPTNVMGSTKHIAEMIVTSMKGQGKMKFAAVRFWNVLRSLGSVIPVFKEQIENGGPVTVTDMCMIRYFMTISEASRLVIQAGIQKIVDAVGGIDVAIDQTFKSNGIAYAEGLNRLDGAAALKYSRIRNDQTEQDTGRQVRQRRVIQAITDKALTMGTSMACGKTGDYRHVGGKRKK